MNWICAQCAQKRTWTMPNGHLATFHIGTCDDCNKKTSVTEHRDYRYGNKRAPTMEEALYHVMKNEAEGKK